MKISPTLLAGVHLVEPELLKDERGWFARSFSAEEFARHGLNPYVSQCSLSYNARAGTLRGMHYQAEPYAEAKLVSCTRGAIYDVALDLRPGSATYCRWFAVELSAGNRKMLYIPEGCAHGYQTLTDDVEVSYQISTSHIPSAARRARWNDPVFAIGWPCAVSSISAADSTAALWSRLP